MRLPARWLDRKQVTKVYSTQEYTFVFETLVPPDTLHRLDTFRDGGPLFARLEGQMLALTVEEQPREDTPKLQSRDRLLEAWNRFDEPDRHLWGELTSEPFEISKELWCTKILGILRPPGRAIIELNLPTFLSTSTMAERCLQYLKAAQVTLDDHRPNDAARDIYLVVEVLSAFDVSAQERHGDLIAKQLQKQRNALGAIANTVRHDPKKPDEQPPQMPRSVAQHLLMSMWSLCAAYFAP